MKAEKQIEKAKTKKINKPDGSELSPTGEIEIDIDQLVESTLPTQARRQARLRRNREQFEQGLSALGNSIIQTNGVIQSIIARPRPGILHRDGKPMFETCVGWRRWQASIHVGLKTIRCVVRDLTDAQILEWQYDENHGREGSSPLDDADYFRHLFNKENYSLEQIADRFNKKVSEIEDLIALNDLCPAAVNDFDEGVLPLKHAVYLAKFFAPDVQEKICKEALAFHYNERKYGAVSFKIFKEEVEEQFVRRLANAPFDTEDERLHLPGTTVAAKCSLCPQRTGFNTLFREIASEDCCLNRECFQFKTNVNLRQKRAEIAEEIAAEEINIGSSKPIEEVISEVPLVTERRYVGQAQPFKEKVKTEVEIYDEPECPHSKRALAVEGTQKGQKVWICENTVCEVHRPPPPEIEPSRIELEEKEERFNKLVRIETRHLIMSDAINSFDDYAVFWIYNDLIRRLIFELIKTAVPDEQSAIARVLEVSPREFSDDQKLREWIAGFDKRRQSQILFLLTFRSSGVNRADAIDELEYIADQWASYEYDRFDAEGRAALAPDEFKEKAERHLKRLKEGEPSRVPRFWTADALDADVVGD